MRVLRFNALFNGEAWLAPAYVSLDADGRIVSLEETPPLDKPEVEDINGIAIPGFVNAHSHAFQYAMAGLSEIHQNNHQKGDFWSWRQAMYGLANQIHPEDLEAIATMLYSDMLRMGYTEVVEFHYLHHQPDGSPYDDSAEMSLRLISAAQKAGIGICLVPVYYNKGGFDRPAEDHQRRFVFKDVEDYTNQLDQINGSIEQNVLCQTGMGVHSLRAASERDIGQLTQLKSPATVFHIHVAEQRREVDECLAFYGCRPVEWMIDRMDLDATYHLVHATHMTDQETTDLAKTGGNVVLCPSTEANLGDGYFNLGLFERSGGVWGIGTDSHIGLNPIEEMRWLDYGQRLIHATRCYPGPDGQVDLGLHLWHQWYQYDQPSQYSPVKGLKRGACFNALVFDAAVPLLASIPVAEYASKIVFASDPSWFLGTMVKGEWVVYRQEHRRASSIHRAFISQMKRMKYRTK